MYLVDTSVWVDFFKAAPGTHVERLQSLLRDGVDVGVTPLILQEILQGTVDTRRFETYRAYFESQLIYLSADPVAAAIRAARMYFDCRRQGITVRSSNDCLIAQAALEHGLVLLHNDADFRRMGTVIPELRETTGSDDRGGRSIHD